jgi:ornithine cyclodeaminase
MKVVFVNEADVHRLLPMDVCVGLMRRALSALARGEAVLPLRQMVWLPDRSGLLGMMPGYLGDPASFGAKIISVMPGNRGSGFDSHQGIVILFGVEHGEPLAIVDATAITAIRTAAASAVATDALARPDAGDLAILGSGAQAVSHLEAMRTVRALRRVRVWSRTRANAERFAAEASRTSGVRVEVSASVEEAVRGADVICTTTSAREPILSGAAVSAGTHVNAVGACFAAWRELDATLVRRARFYTDCRESCLNEAGDFLLAKQDGAIDEAHLLGELGQVLVGNVPGRVSPDDVTIYESLGIAVEDLASAQEIHQRAVATGAGQWLTWK